MSSYGVQKYRDPDQAIRATTNQVFDIEIEANPTTGYLWQARVDRRHLELLGQETKPGHAIGAGGRETFRFRALEAGETEILLEHKRPWEQEVLDTKRFQITIT